MFVLGIFLFFCFDFSVATFTVLERLTIVSVKHQFFIVLNSSVPFFSENIVFSSFSRRKVFLWSFLLGRGFIVFSSVFCFSCKKHRPFKLVPARICGNVAGLRTRSQVIRGVCALSSLQVRLEGWESRHLYLLRALSWSHTPQARLFGVFPARFSIASTNRSADECLLSGCDGRRAERLVVAGSGSMSILLCQRSVCSRGEWREYLGFRCS